MTIQRSLFAYCTLLALTMAVVPARLSAQAGAGATMSAEALRKCDPWLKHRLFTEPDGAGNLATTANESLTMFVTGDPQRLPALVHDMGGRIGSMAGSIATVTIPRRSLEALAALGEVRRLELAMPVELDQDSARRHVYADPVLQGRPPLEGPVTGKGVIVGVIDTGIDFRHPEFLDDDGNTRILSIWSQTDLNGPAPEGFDYGREWNRGQIDAALDGSSGAVGQKDTYGHGTHVAAIAAGRHGIAPDADIIMVQFHNTFEALTTDVLDAASYIYRRAAAEGKPCVINASLGGNDHFHDGSDPISRGLEALMAESPGRIFVASAGNRGQRNAHWGGFAAEQDSLWTFTFAQKVSLRIADSSLADFEISIQVDTDGSGSAETIGQAPWRSVARIADAPGFADTIGSATLAFTAASLDNGNTGVIIDLGRSAHLFRVLVRGRGTFHAWSQRFDGTPLDVGTNGRYRKADSTMSIGSPGISRDVITVGSSVNRASYQTLGRGKYPSPPARAGARSGFSSIGPRSDGVAKPDIVAPGENVISARSSALGPNDINDWQRLADSRFMPNSGTSMAAPVVAGAVALYLQLHPAATSDEVRTAIERSALHDRHTESGGPLPNGQWGMGKLDLFGMLTGIRSSVPLRTTEPISRGRLRSRPIPATGIVAIDATDGSGDGGTLVIYNAIGLEIERRELTAGSGEILLDVRGWPTGIYHCRLSGVENPATGKIVVAR